MTKSSKKHWPLFRFLGKLLFHDFVVPTQRLIIFIMLGSMAIILGYILDIGMFVFWAYNSLLLIFSAVDLLLLPRRSEWSIKRLLPERVDVGQQIEVQLLLTTRQPQFVRIELMDDLPRSFEVGGRSYSVISELGLLEKAAPLTTGAFEATSGTYTYATRAEERGLYTFNQIFLRYYGGIGLWKKQMRVELPQEIRVYPDLSAVRGILGSLQNALILEGNRIHRKIRRGSDFHYVRDYSEGDEPRHINWKASARTAKLMTNEYRPEKGKIVTLLLDCGRMMGIELDGQVKLDRCLEAALTLASVALKQGDQVSILAFSNRVKVYVPPGRGVAHLHTLTEALYDLKHDFVEPSYSTALAYLQRSLKKRSFIVLFSDMESYLYDNGLLPYMQKLRRGNPALLLSLGDPLLYDWARIQVKDSHHAYIQSIAHKLTMDRKRYIHIMAGKGIPVLDVPADQLTLSVVNAYLDLKARDAL